MWWVLPIPLLVGTVLGLVSVAAIVWSVCTILQVFLPSGEKASGGRFRGGKSLNHSRAPGTYLDRPDGSRLLVQSFGAADAPAPILTHGWGTDAELWQYARRELS
jgi:hypothetical protein